MTAGVGSASATQVGVNVTQFLGAPALTAKTEALIDQLHPAWIRVFLDWYAYEPTPGNYDGAQVYGYQQFFSSLPAGTKVDVDVTDTPPWANGGASEATPPSNDQSFGAFMNYLANAYGRWVGAWEIWNEEDSSANWTGTPAQYASLLQAAYPAIHSAEPDALVVMGANTPQFLAAVYAAGGGGYFDAVASHTDTACLLASPYLLSYEPGTQVIEPYSFLSFISTHDVMAANGDAAKPILMTELGWSSDTGTCTSGTWTGKKAGGVSEKIQAKYLEPQYSYVLAGMWYTLQDSEPASSFFDHYGLVTTNFAAKPAFRAFERESLRGDPLHGPCGSFNGPTLHLDSPWQGERYKGPLLIKVTAVGHGKPVTEIKLEHDGKVIMYFNPIDAHEAHDVLTGSIDWQGARYLPVGAHTISVVATYANNLTSTATVTVEHK
jgi:hypothetical protein